MLKREIRIFCTALMFYTRIPIPKWIDYHYREEYLNEATKYFPLIGWIVGSVSGIVFLTTQHLIPTIPALVLAMLSSILLTGAFHEDGFADVCDAFGGGWTKQKILDIMKDSRLGTYGTIGLIGILSLKFSLLYSISVFTPKQVFFALIAGNACSRFMAALMIFTSRYVRENDDSKAKPVAKKLKIHFLIIGGVLGIVPVYYFFNLYGLLTFLPMLISFLYLQSYFKKWIGGYTGDCLGTVQQISEVIFYLSLIIIWKFTL